MSMTFTKLFSSITESTVWCEPDRTRLVWITMLAMADRYGRVWGSIPGLANRARVPVEDARLAITTFLSPDPDSRSPEQEGRRITEIDGGWQLINHQKYRVLRDEEERRRQNREAKARQRKKVSQGQPKVSQGQPTGQPIADAETDAETEKTKIYISSPSPTKKKSSRKSLLPANFTISDAIKTWAKEHGYTRLNERLDHFKDTAIARGYEYIDWDAAFRNAIRDNWAKLGDESPDEFAHFPRIDFECHICGCRVGSDETCQMAWHGMNREQHEAWMQADWESKQ